MAIVFYDETSKTFACESGKQCNAGERREAGREGWWMKKEGGMKSTGEREGESNRREKRTEKGKVRERERERERQLSAEGIPSARHVILYCIS